MVGGRRRWAPALAGLVLAALTGACEDGDADEARPADVGVVRHVVDGDTAVVRIGDATETVRLIGIDTPETNHPEIGAECYGAEATDRLRQLLPVGSEVRLERDVEARDRFGRLLAYVHALPSDELVNLVLVEEGFADARVYGDNDALADLLAGAEARARARGLGLWGACGSADVPVEGGGGDR